MLTPSFVALSFLSTTLSPGFTPQEKPSAPAKEVVVKVGKLDISRRDLRDETNRLIPLSSFHGRVSDKKMLEFQAKALKQLIEKGLIYLDAQDRKLEVGEEEIRAEFRRALKMASPGKKAPTAEQEAQMIKQYRPLILRRILLDKNNARFRASLKPVTDQAIHAHYLAHQKELLAPREAKLRHILVKVAPSASDQEVRKARKLVVAAHERILAGTSFAEVAKEVSQDIYAQKGGELGWVKKGSFLHGPVDRAAFKLKEGEVSEVLDSIYGFHLIQCVKLRARRQLKRDEVGEQIRSLLGAQTRHSSRMSWLAELKQRHPVQILAKDLHPPRGKDPRKP